MRLHRKTVRNLQEPLSEYDSQFELCRMTGYSYASLLTRIASCNPITVANFTKEMRCSGRALYLDNGRWSMLLQWIKLYVDQWEDKFMEVTSKELTEIPNSGTILEVFAKALGMEEGALLYFSQHRDEIELFLETQRGLLGTLAELKLWDLVQKGDAATIRWLLPRIKTGEYGDKEFTNQSGRKINIIEVDGHI